jgi:integrase
VRTVLQGAMAKANIRLEAAGEPIIEHATNHSLRRSFCALLFASGASLPEVISAMGHTSPTLSLAVYAKAIVRQSDTTSRADQLLRDASRTVRAANPVSALGDATFAEN